MGSVGAARHREERFIPCPTALFETNCHEELDMHTQRPHRTRWILIVSGLVGVLVAASLVKSAASSDSGDEGDLAAPTASEADAQALRPLKLRPGRYEFAT